MRTSEHDKFFAYAFSLVVIVRHFILEFFPEEVACLLDLDRLFRDDTRYVKGDHAELFSDIVWRTVLKKTAENKRDAVIALLFERKSSRPASRTFIWGIPSGNLVR